MIPLETLTFFLSSIITFTLIYYHVPSSNLQQIIATLLVLLLLFLNRFAFRFLKKVPQEWFRVMLLFFSSLFTQLLVILTGGFYSPLLILLHLYTLGSSFLLNISSSISFLIFSLVDLTASVFFNPIFSAQYQNDPWSVVLYFTSFVIIIPLAMFLMRSYRVKDAISKVLAEYSQTVEQREESILRGLDELIFVTDINLHIISVNSAVEKLLSTSSNSLINKYFLDSIKLSDKDGNPADIQTLSVNSALNDKATHIVKEFYLSLKENKKPSSVVVQIRPITNLEGKVNQLVFVITESVRGGTATSTHEDLQPAWIRHEVMADDLKKNVALFNSAKVSTQLELYSRTQEDLLTALEIEDHTIRPKMVLQNVAVLSNKIIETKQEFARSLKVNLEFILPEGEVGEESLIKLEEEGSPYAALSISKFLAPLDSRWFGVMLNKLLDLGILLASNQNNPSVKLNLERDTKYVTLSILTTYPALSDSQRSELFIKYYGQLSDITNLKYGSGLEGFIAKTISDKLEIPIIVESSNHPPLVKFIIHLSMEIHPE